LILAILDQQIYTESNHNRLTRRLSHGRDSRHEFLASVDAGPFNMDLLWQFRVSYVTAARLELFLSLALPILVDVLPDIARPGEKPHGFFTTILPFSRT
jgi:hypothetical protein